MPDSEAKLHLHEWLAVATLIGFMGMLTFITLTTGSLNISTTDAPHYVVDQEISVFFEGAVENPGRYQVKKGTLIKDLLSQVKPKPQADLRRIKGESKVRNGQVIKVPEQKKKKP
jgi:hypothetical protein